jgi:hypothetical protein
MANLTDDEVIQLLALLGLPPMVAGDRFVIEDARGGGWYFGIRHRDGTETCAPPDVVWEIDALIRAFLGGTPR